MGVAVPLEVVLTVEGEGTEVAGKGPLRRGGILRRVVHGRVGHLGGAVLGVVVVRGGGGEGGGMERWW